MSKHNAKKLICSVSVILTAVVCIADARADAARDKWCSNVHIRFFVGGAEGDAFGTVVYNGARQAAADTGAKVDYVFSKWQSEKMIEQLREAVAAHPDGIAMMGEPGEAAILPLAEKANAAGIKIIYLNSPVPAAQTRFGSGYVGVQQEPQGRALAQEIVRRFHVKAGSKTIVLGPFDDSIRGARAEGAAKALEKAGISVIRINVPPEWATDPNLGIPVIAAVLQANPDAKAIVYPGGQVLGNVPTYMRVAGKKPGQIINTGFDTSPQIVEAFRTGWVQLTADQEPFQQGYMPIVSLCQQIVLGLAPFNLDTGNGFITEDNYKSIANLASQGLR